SIYGYTPEEEVPREVTEKIYEQTVDYLEIVQVIAAVNAPSEKLELPEYAIGSAGLQPGPSPKS
ncbi:hypothetical protein LCGC14_2363340, partial [marine sediment metagenome]